MREKILAVIEKNSRIDIHDLAILLGENEVAVANEIAEMEKERKKNCLSIFVLSQRRMRCFAC